MLILLHVSMHTEHTYIYASMLACMSTHIHVCLHACIQASMYACLHTHGIEMDGWIGRQNGKERKRARYYPFPSILYSCSFRSGGNVVGQKHVSAENVRSFSFSSRYRILHGCSPWGDLHSMFTPRAQQHVGCA